MIEVRFWSLVVVERGGRVVGSRGCCDCVVVVVVSGWVWRVGIAVVAIGELRR